MKKIFYLSVIALIVFEIANVYFIMPLPGSQESETIDLAYFLYSWRWMFRSIFSTTLLLGLFKAQWKKKWLLAIPFVVLSAIVYMVNFVMTADRIFTQPQKIILATAQNNSVDTNRLVIGVVDNGIAKAYPIQFLGYHHFVYDTLNNKSLLITYCTVCRTGRVFDPTINGKVEQFRLVGMDHFNAMIEDASTKSWWRQSTGEAITGELKGSTLAEIHSTQTTLSQWLKMYPQSFIMQEDDASVMNYDTSFHYENGTSKRSLTGTDRQSWKDKSWVVGVKVGNKSKAFDWNELLQKRILHSTIDNTHFFVFVCNDNKSFFAYQYTSNTLPKIVNDTIVITPNTFRVNGTGIDTSLHLKPLHAYQEFWHSWKTFQPATLK